MAVHVECLHGTPIGLMYSIAHYYEQAGDLCCDPDVTLVRTADGWSPVRFQNSIAYRIAVRFHEDGTVEVDEREQRDLISFVGTWMANVREQQGLTVKGGGPTTSTHDQQERGRAGHGLASFITVPVALSAQ